MTYLFSIRYNNCDINCWKLQNISLHLRLHKKNEQLDKGHCPPMYQQYRKGLLPLPSQKILPPMYM